MTSICFLEGITAQRIPTRKRLNSTSVHQPLLKSKSWDTGDVVPSTPQTKTWGGGRLPEHTPQHITLVRAQAEVSLRPERTAARARRQKPTRRTRRPAVERTQRAPGPRCVDTAPGIRRHDAASDTAGSHAHVRPAWPSLAQPAANVAEPPWGRGGTKHRRAENRGSL